MLLQTPRFTHHGIACQVVYRHCEGREPDPNFCNVFGQLFITDFKAQPVSHLHVQRACFQAVLTPTRQA